MIMPLKFLISYINIMFVFVIYFVLKMFKNIDF